MHRLEPFVWAALFLVEAGTDHRRQCFDGGLNAGEAASCPIYRADDRMDVGVATFSGSWEVPNQNLFSC